MLLARRLTRLTVLICLVLTPFTPIPQAPSSPAGETPMAGMYPEVRLRKLHLVRPDLIPYPIAYEVCC